LSLCQKVEVHRTKETFAAYRQRLTDDRFEHNQNEYRLSNGDITLKLTELAITSQERKISADANDLSEARKLLRHIRIKYPAIAHDRAYQKLEAALSNL
jgi:hypothetical protein